MQALCPAMKQTTPSQTNLTIFAAIQSQKLTYCLVDSLPPRFSGTTRVEYRSFADAVTVTALAIVRWHVLLFGTMVPSLPRMRVQVLGVVIWSFWLACLRVADEMFDDVHPPWLKSLWVIHRAGREHDSDCCCFCCCCCFCFGDANLLDWTWPWHLLWS